VKTGESGNDPVLVNISYLKIQKISYYRIIYYEVFRQSDVIKTIRISAYGRNLAVWGLDDKGVDPEIVVGGDGNIQGLEGGIVPATRSYGFNLQLKF